MRIPLSLAPARSLSSSPVPAFGRFCFCRVIDHCPAFRDLGPAPAVAASEILFRRGTHSPASRCLSSAHSRKCAHQTAIRPPAGPDDCFHA